MLKTILISLLLAVGGPGVFVEVAQADGDLHISWAGVSGVPDMAGYHIYLTQDQNVWPEDPAVTVQSPAITCVIPGLPDGTYFFKIASYDLTGNEGPYSATFTATVLDTTGPPPPTGIQWWVEQIVAWILNLFGIGRTA